MGSLLVGKLLLATRPTPVKMITCVRTRLEESELLKRN